jgi:hypothetical protein
MFLVIAFAVGVSWIVVDGGHDRAVPGAGGAVTLPRRWRSNTNTGFYYYSYSLFFFNSHLFFFIFYVRVTNSPVFVVNFEVGTLGYR